MYILEFLKGQKPEQPGNDVITCEYRLLCSGELYNGDVETLDWRKSTLCRLLLNSPFTVFVASDPREANYPQELALRFTTHMVTEEHEYTYKTSYSYYPDEEIAKDIAALLCLFCRRLITVCAKVREIHPKQYENEPEVLQDLPVDFIKSLKIVSWKRHLSTVIYGPNGIEGIEDYNPQPKALSPQKLKKLFLALPDLPYAESIIHSARLYALSLEQIYQGTDIAYQLLISSIETIANEVYRSYAPTKSDVVKAKKNVADLALKLGLSKEKADRLATEACKGISWHARKFSKFLTENTDGELWTKDDLFKLPDFVLPNKNNFESVIDEIYKERAKASHSGYSYPASASIVPGPRISAKALFDTDISQNPFPPVAWFERVVNNAIRGFMERAIGASEKSTAK